MGRWPFCFDPEDVEVENYVGTDLGDPEIQTLTQGVRMTHKPTGETIIFNAFGDRDANIANGYRRLDIQVRRAQAADRR
jgi:protein subunit release factor A